MELYREVGKSFHAVNPLSAEPRPIQGSAVDELCRLRRANSELESLVKEHSLRLKQYKQSLYRIKHHYMVQKRQNTELKTIVGRYRSVMTDFIQDSASVV
jgi:hypothetical protein